jgi:geranylgeranyl diphosphate synthase type II
VYGDVWDHLKPRQAAVEQALRGWFTRLTADVPPPLAAAMGYSLFAPGKRLRPLLCVLACEAVGGTMEQALTAGCAVEMVHTYSLIHDDLPAMDDDDLRRGLPTCHVKFGEALAILAGDALLTAAFEVLGSGYGSKTAAVSCVELARGAGATGMVGGQVMDLTADGRIAPSGGRQAPEAQGPDGPRSEQGLQAIHRLKTGALFRSSLRLGLYAAQAERGVDPTAAAALDAYASAFGLAFQVTDDLIDVQGTSEVTGKRVGKDAARGKLTYPGLLGIDASRRKADDLGRQAVAAADALGLGGAPLAALARYVVDRDR